MVGPFLIGGSVLGVLAWFPALRSRALAAVEGSMVLSLRGLVVSYGLAVLFAVVQLVMQGHGDGNAPSRWVAACVWVIECGLVVLLAFITAWAVAELRGLVSRPRTPVRATAAIAILVVIGTVLVLSQVTDNEWSTGASGGPPNGARFQLDNFAMGLHDYRRSNGNLPESLELLLRSDAFQVREEEELRALLVDPWGSPWAYERSEAGFVLRCAGPDRQLGSGDDIVVRWSPP